MPAISSCHRFEFSFVLQGGQPVKAIEPHPPEVSLAIQRQVLQSLLLVCIQGLLRESRSRTQGLRHSVNVLAQYGAHPYQYCVNMLTQFTSNLFCHITKEAAKNKWNVKQFHLSANNNTFQRKQELCTEVVCARCKLSANSRKEMMAESRKRRAECEDGSSGTQRIAS